jgi:hypothetical protein
MHDMVQSTSVKIFVFCYISLWLSAGVVLQWVARLDQCNIVVIIN